MILSVFYFTLFPILYCHGVKITTYSLEVTNHAHFFLSKEAILNEALTGLFPPETKAVIGPGQRSCSFQKPTFHGQISSIVFLRNHMV